jgi:hypothetical protein
LLKRIQKSAQEDLFWAHYQSQVATVSQDHITNGKKGLEDATIDGEFPNKTC